jgi:hypothetical protein
MPRSIYADFRRELAQATRDAWVELQSLIGRERLYVFALYTSGQDGFSYLCASANTAEALGDVGHQHRAWLAPDWKYHDFSQRVRDVKLPEGDSRRRDSAVYAAFVTCLKTLDGEGLFGRGDERNRLSLLILCGDYSEEFFRHGLEQLNPLAVVDDYVRNFTPDGFFARIHLLPAEERMEKIFALYLALSLERATPAAEEAQRAHVTKYDVERRIVNTGARAVSRLIELIDDHALAPAFNPPGSEAFAKYGAFTLQSSLATSAVFALAKCAYVSDEQVCHLQGILARRVDADRELSKTSTLGENLARVLHQLRPKRFPKSQLDEHTNHLRNPGAFLV